MSSPESTMTKTQRIMKSSRDNSESIGVSLAVVLAYGFSTYTSAALPAEVVAALGSLIGAFSARMKG